MNSFINKVGTWFKKSAFGLIITTLALVFVICVGIIVNRNSAPVSKVTDSPQVVDSTTPTQEQETPTIEKIKMPFTINAKISRYFFDSSDDISIKKQALVSYDNKYIPSLGVDYTYNNETFEVLTSFKGKVVEKTNDSLYGLTIVIENEEGLRAHYCGLSDVKVYLNDQVNQGSLIGHSGESVINAALGNHLHFALQFNDKFINPLKAYDKTVEDAIK